MIQQTQNRQLYVQYGASHENFGRPTDMKGGDIDATIVCTPPFTLDEIDHLIRMVDRFAHSYGPPGSIQTEDGKLLVAWHKSMPHPGPGYELYRR